MPKVYTPGEEGANVQISGIASARTHTCPRQWEFFRPRELGAAAAAAAVKGNECVAVLNRHDSVSGAGWVFAGSVVYGGEISRGEWWWD